MHVDKLSATRRGGELYGDKHWQMVDKNQPVVDNVHCPTSLGPTLWITYPPGWWIDILIIHRPIEAWKTYPQHVWKEFCDPDI
jgi:hypothetical protein